MQVLTIVEDNRVTGVIYGMKEIADNNITPVLDTKKYQQIQNKNHMRMKNYRIRQK